MPKVPTPASSSILNTSRLDLEGLSDREIRYTLFEAYVTVQKLLELAGFDIHCAIKQVYLRFGRRKIEHKLPSHTKVRYAIGMTRALRAIPGMKQLITYIIRTVISRFDMEGMVQEQRMIDLIFDVHLNDMIQYLYDESYIWNTDQFAQDALAFVERRGLVKLYGKLQLVVKRKLLMNHAKCSKPIGATTEALAASPSHTHTRGGGGSGGRTRKSVTKK
jgi:hypothetical protein